MHPLQIAHTKKYVRPMRLKAQLHKYFHISVWAMYPGAFYCQSFFNGAKLHMWVKTHLKVLFPLLMYFCMKKQYMYVAFTSHNKHAIFHP